MSAFLGDWTYGAIHKECKAAWSVYRKGLDAHHASYFKAHPELAGEHPQLAANIAAALPPGMEWLAAEIPAASLHRHHLSGKSSQLIGLALLGTAVKAEPALKWLEEPLSPVAPFDSLNPPTVGFEHELDKSVLNEEPRVTAVDFFVESADAVICAEVKFSEDGLGRCSCGAAAAVGANCAQRVLDRPLYWQTAKEIFLLPDRVPGKSCPISAGYQAVRNAAAAIALAKGRKAMFALIYDDRNPYFRPTGSWPGWPAVLAHTLEIANNGGQLRFRAVSWQELVPEMPLLAAVRAWAAEKHQLT